MSRTWGRLLALPLLLVALASCTGGEAAGDDPASTNLPAGADLVRQAAAEMRKVTTTRFELQTEGRVDQVPVRGGEGRLTRTGGAQGKLRIDQGGGPLELDFVVVGDEAFIKGPTGGFQPVPLATAAAVYDPSAILDPERGIARLLGTAKAAKTEAKESVAGKEAYRVEARFDRQAIAALVPGLDQEVTGEVWIGADRPVVTKARIPVGTSTGPGGAFVVTFTDFDAPVTVTPPPK
jgi:lipoprotein LprG